MNAKRSAGVTQSADGSYASPGIKATKLVVGTVSWARGDDDEPLSRARFIEALKASVAAKGKVPHVLLCAGHTLSTTPQAATVLQATDDIPVIFETRNRDGSGSYRLAMVVDGAPTSIVLRNRQLVVHAGDATPNGALQTKLVGLIAQGAGVIATSATGPALVLLICGENNAVHHAKPPSVMHGGQNETLDVMKRPWVLLNPAHTPYATAGGGRVKIETGQYGHGPMLGHLAAANTTFNDGTTSPIAVVHCNTFFVGDGARAETTRRNSSVVFTRDSAGERLEPLLVVSDAAPAASWIHARYAL